jgi:hypothetical protein
MNRNFQWISIFGSVFFIPCLALGADDASREVAAKELPKPLVRIERDRDPTAPSSQMLERIGATKRSTAPPVAQPENRSLEVTPAVAQPTDIRIKAIVLSDDDNGSAILTANGRTISIKLSRAKLRLSANEASRSQIGFTLGNVTFIVEDFSENSIRLRLSSDNSVLIIQ